MQKWFDAKLRDVALHGEMVYEENRQWEFRATLAWLQFKPPSKVCVSEQGIFTHHEVDQ
jgi:hypothetical protein